MGKIKDWEKTFESKNIIRYKNFEGDTLEIAKAEEVRGKLRWFIYLITKNKILDFPSNKTGGLSKVEAKKEALRYMTSKDWTARGY